MSVYLRAVTPYQLRVPILQHRLFSSKTSEQIKEDALKILEKMSALELKDPKQLFDDDIVFRADDFDFGQGDIDMEKIPASPIMDTKAWKRRFKQPRKLRKRHTSEMTEEDWELRKNPYANTLITAARQDGYYRRVFPSFFLQKMHAYVNPETKDPWLLPMGIKSQDAKKVVTGISKYVGGNHSHIEFLKSKRWRKLQDTRFVTSAVWRLDMEDFILKQLQTRVYEEVAASQRWIMSANREGGKWEDMKIGCLLIWENGDPDFQVPADTSTEETCAGEEPPQEPVDIVSQGEEGQKEAIMDETLQAKSNTVVREVAASRSLIGIKGKLVPSYKMHLLLGREEAAKLKKQLKIEEAVRKNVLLVSPRTTKSQMWLWKLSGYARQPGTSLFKDHDMKSGHDEQNGAVIPSNLQVLDGALMH
ncbi:hypothetical protein TWF730_004918 [Orbilia blumenaviensis]|uniref:Uncharacterized protein n=1 Tax=Orbilia blumenaviensis TaxID=1796055 RepID=A0AAV9VH00_9PEZI